MNEPLVISEIHGRVGLLKLNRPKKHNALSDEMFDALNVELDRFEANPDIGCIVLTGVGKSFAAGADIASMAKKTFAGAYKEGFISNRWEHISRCRKPIIAAVDGYVLGGGFELALMCDIIYAGENALFGFPEVQLGVLPGAGGTQRLPKAVGKAKAMELCLTGSMMTAHEAARAGIVAATHETDVVLSYSMKVAERIAGFSLPSVMMIKESINASFETSLKQGLAIERQFFHATFALQDQKEGMQAFLTKRQPEFVHE